MKESKTKQTDQNIDDYLNKIEPEEKRDNCFEIMALMQKITGKKAKMWGGSVIGFGKYHYKYASGHEGESCQVGFSPRKQHITIYVIPWFKGFSKYLEKLGKYKSGVGCIYIKRLSDINISVLENIIEESVKFTKKTYKS